MFNSISESFKKIYKEKKFFFSSLVSSIVIFIIFNIFAFVMYHLYNSKVEIEYSGHGIIYIKNMSENEIREFEGKISKIEEIYATEFTSKESSLSLLEKELNIDLSNDENPLLDSYYIYINKNVDVNKLKEKLISISEILEIDINIEEINNINKFSKKLEHRLKYAAAVLLAIFFILLSNIMSSSVKIRRNEIKASMETGVKGYIIKFMFFIENFIIIILSSVLAFYIIKELYFMIGSEFNEINISTLKKDEMIQILLFSIMFGVTTIIYTNFIGLYSYYKKNKELEIDESSDEKNIETTETVENQEDKKEIE